MMASDQSERNQLILFLLLDNMEKNFLVPQRQEVKKKGSFRPKRLAPEHAAQPLNTQGHVIHIHTPWLKSQAPF